MRFSYWRHDDDEEASLFPRETHPSHPYPSVEEEGEEWEGGRGRGRRGAHAAEHWLLGLVR